MEQIWLMPLKEIYLFLRWWGWDVPSAIFGGTKNLLLDFDEVLQFEANSRLWLAVEPLFGDRTWSGRLVGFVMRGVRVIFTLAIYAGILAIGSIAILGWLTSPLLIFSKIL